MLKDSPGPVLSCGWFWGFCNAFPVCVCVCVLLRKPEWVSVACKPEPWLLQESHIMKNDQTYTWRLLWLLYGKRTEGENGSGQEQLGASGRAPGERMGAWASVQAVEKGKGGVDRICWWMGSRGHLNFVWFIWLIIIPSPCSAKVLKQFKNIIKY